MIESGSDHPYGSRVPDLAPGVVNQLLEARCESTVGRLEIILVGELDISNADRLQGLLDGWVAGSADARCVSIDASELTFMDSSGVQVLMSLRRHLEATGCGLEIRGANRTVRLVLETLGLTSLLGVVGDGPASDPTT